MGVDRTKYSSLLGRRYGKDMGPVFSDDRKFQLWRECWVALAESQYQLGLAGVTEGKVAQLREYVHNINYDVAEAKEREIRHDVMSHVYAFGEQCLDAKGIIHAGATSCDITDNAELIQMHEALRLVKTKLVGTIKLLGDFSMKYKDLACLGYTHFQPAQPTTVGKRAAMWTENFVIDYHQINGLYKDRKLRGLKGATGTQASFLELADGDEAKVVALNELFLKTLGYDDDFCVTGQTYPRKYDSIVLQALAGIGESAHKFGLDFRILQHKKELEEPFEEKQTGSSAMAYKRNPMRLERMCSLARDAMINEMKPRITSSVQLFERTLDDSAARRDYVPQTFIGIDEVLNLAMNVMENPAVFPLMIKRNLDVELPFMATENIMMASVKRGKSRQDIHELIRQYSHEAGRRVKEEGKDNELLRMLADDERIGMSLDEINEAVDVRKFIGRAPQQVEEFYEREIQPILDIEGDASNVKSNVQV
ncbi:MAG: adenylosuccinate lyase [Nanoarchaeota archaeon]